MGRLQAGLHALGQQMIIAMADIDDLGPAELLAAFGIGDAAAGIDRLVVADTELMRRDPRQFGLQLLRGMERGAARA